MKQDQLSMLSLHKAFPRKKPKRRVTTQYPDDPSKLSLTGESILGHELGHALDVRKRRAALLFEARKQAANPENPDRKAAQDFLDWAEPLGGYRYDILANFNQKDAYNERTGLVGKNPIITGNNSFEVENMIKNELPSTRNLAMREYVFDELTKKGLMKPEYLTMRFEYMWPIIARAGIDRQKVIQAQNNIPRGDYGYTRPPASTNPQ
jgi:hypothetical protein